MKKAVSIAMLSLILLAACKKDENKPYIILLGQTVQTIELNGFWTEPGWTASDDEDGSLTEKVVVTGDSVDVNLAGTYVRTYTVSDKAGNTASKTRTIYVVNSSINRGGSYNVIDTTDIVSSQVETYQVELIPSITQNNVVAMKNFRDKGNQSAVNLKFISISSLTIDAQRPDMGAGFEGEVTGSGVVLTNQTSMRIGYQIDYDNLPDKIGVLQLARNK